MQFFRKEIHRQPFRRCRTIYGIASRYRSPQLHQSDVRLLVIYGDLRFDNGPDMEENYLREQCGV